MRVTRKMIEPFPNYTTHVMRCLGMEPDPWQAQVLEGLLEVPEGFRFSDLERWRRGPDDPTGKSLRLALRRVAEIDREPRLRRARVL